MGWVIIDTGQRIGITERTGIDGARFRRCFCHFFLMSCCFFLMARQEEEAQDRDHEDYEIFCLRLHLCNQPLA